MHWYIAKIVFRIICGDGLHQPQFDEQLRLIKAVDEAAACKKAHSIGIFEQDEFISTDGKRVQWKFIGVPELNPLVSIADGAELLSSIHEPEDAEGYISLIHQRALRFNTVKAKAVSDNSFVTADSLS
ncbi:MAG: DUF4288 domain-containing protein [Chitinophagales bacterium]|nr:DUF4288 domain-containing protein [Chitinophagales bacterium]